MKSTWFLAIEEEVKDAKIVLASQSPNRLALFKELVSYLFFKFTFKNSQSKIHRLTPKAIIAFSIKYLGLFKAWTLLKYHKFAKIAKGEMNVFIQSQIAVNPPF